ncbi:Complement C1q tumor necrosis factor-related protein 1 [Varanus komodoensis]|nr:Complement C1q tumor necrosis factor-related protein 1 [Varanus komodoensis]
MKASLAPRALLLVCLLFQAYCKERDVEEMVGPTTQPPDQHHTSRAENSYEKYSRQQRGPGCVRCCNPPEPVTVPPTYQPTLQINMTILKVKKAIFLDNPIDWLGKTPQPAMDNKLWGKGNNQKALGPKNPQAVSGILNSHSAYHGNKPQWLGSHDTTSHAAEGEKGDRGERGPQGKLGKTGAAGGKGQVGLKGKKGSPGSPGERYKTTYAAFSVGRRKPLHSNDYYQTLVFDTEYVNLYSHFNMFMGKFYCYVPGIYFFSLNVHTWNQKETYLHIMRNGAEVAILYAQASDRSIMQSQSLMLDLQDQDEVWVRLFKGERENAIFSDDYDTYITFSGYLIKPSSEP